MALWTGGLGLASARLGFLWRVTRMEAPRFLWGWAVVDKKDGVTKSSELTISEGGSMESLGPLGGHAEDSGLALLVVLLAELESLGPDVLDEPVDEVGVEGAEDVPEVLALDLVGLGEPLLRDVPLEVGDLAGQGQDPLDRDLDPLGDAEAPDLLVGEAEAALGHDALEEAQRAVLQRREVHLLQGERVRPEGYLPSAG